MAQIFISYSSVDQAAADAVVAGLRERGIQSFFLSSDPKAGIEAGEEWERRLYAELKPCRLLMPLLSPAWLASPWCHAELRIARFLGKTIFPVKIADCQHQGVAPELQQVELYLRGAEGLDRLAGALKGQLLGRVGAYRPGQQLFRGLLSLEAEDAAIFFGRDEETIQLKQMLQSKANEPVGSGPRAVVLAGASGVGKSSLVRAGLLPWLNVLPNQGNFWLASPLRPADGLNGPKQSLSSVLDRLLAQAKQPSPGTLSPSSAPVAAKALGAAMALLGREEPAWTAPRDLLLFVDQAEQLLVNENFASVLDALATSPDLALVLLLACRDDAAVALQTRFQADIFPLPTMASERLGEVIRGPLHLAGKADDAKLDKLIDAILRDAVGAADALPCVAQLLFELEARKDFTVESYEAIGGLSRVIENSAEHAYVASVRDGDAAAAVERLFIPGMIAFDKKGDMHLTRFDEACIAPAAQPFVSAMLKSYLLRRTKGDDGRIWIEPAHEALLRRWKRLAEWILAATAPLAILAQAGREAREWNEVGQPLSEAYLRLRGERLAGALHWRDDATYASTIDTLSAAYLEACARLEAKLLAEQKAQDDQTRRGLALLCAAEAAKASDAGRYDRALRFGLAGWCAADPAPPEIEAELARAAYAKREVARVTHEGDVGFAMFSPDGLRIVTASYDKIARICDAQTGSEIARVTHESAVKSAMFSSDGLRIVTASCDKTARICDAQTGREVARVIHNHTVMHAAFSLDGARIVTASEDKTARICDAYTGKEIARVRHNGAVRFVAFSPDGTRIVTASEDETVQVSDAHTGRKLARVKHGAPVYSAAFSPDGLRIVTASDDKTARVCDAHTGRKVARVKHGAPVYSAVFSPDGLRIVTASDDKTARVCDAQTGREIVRVGHNGSVYSASFSSDGLRILTASKDKSVRVSNAESGREVSHVNHDGLVCSAAFSPDGKRVVSTSVDRTARVSEAQENPEVIRILDTSAFLAESASMSLDGQRIVTGWLNGSVLVSNVHTGHELTLVAHKGSVKSVSFSPDGKRVVTASLDGTARVFDAQTGHEILKLTREGFPTFAVFSPEGQRIATVWLNGAVCVNDAQTGDDLVHIAHDDVVNSVNFSPDGQRIVTASNDGIARVYGAQTWDEILRIGHYDYVDYASFSSDGRRVLTVSHDSTARVIDAQTGCTIAQVTHEDAVTSVTFSLDGQRIVASSDNGAVRISDMQTSREIALVVLYDDYPHFVTFSPDGQGIVTGHSQKIHLWDVRWATGLTGGALIEAICRKKLHGCECFSAEDFRGALVPELPHNPVAEALKTLAERRQRRGEG